MAHTKSQKATRGNRDSVSKRLGIKLYGGQPAEPGNIIVRQRGMTFKSGKGTYLSKDYTIHADIAGVVKYITRYGRKYVTVTPQKS